MSTSSKTTSRILSVLAMLISSIAHAGTYVEECMTCNSMSHASLFAQARGHDLEEGTHSVFVVNTASSKGWEFTISVIDLGNGQPILGDKIVNVVSSSALPQAVEQGLQELKDAGLVSLKDDVTYFIELDDFQLGNECPSASGGLCAEVVNLLQSRPETLLWATGMGRIRQVLNRFWEWISGIAGPKLQYVVIFPNGSSEIYVFVAQGQATGFVVKANTAVSSSGSAPNGGSLGGWASFVSSPGTTTVQFYRSGSGGTGCRVGYSIVLNSAFEVVSVTATSTC